MAFHLSILLLLAGLTEIHSITTVSDVSVKEGGSISIPCLYDPRYRNHVKYLCEGSRWASCDYAVRSNQPSRSGKFSISDDPNQSIFNVTINNLSGDTRYWCAVEIDNGGDVNTEFRLSVSRDMPRLYVEQQQITGYNGGDITIYCHHHHSLPGLMKWCRLGRSCMEGTTGSIDGTAVTINADAPNVFIVTMRGLRRESSGWYWCAKGDFQMPVHINVSEQMIPTTLPTTTLQQVSVSAISSQPCEPPGTQEEERHFNNLKNLIIPLSFLIFIVMGASFIWWMLRRRKQAKGKSSAMVLAEQDIINSNGWHSRKTSSQRSYAESDVDVMYSTVRVKQHKTVQRQNQVSNDDVTYSTVAMTTKSQPKQKQVSNDDVTYSTVAVTPKSQPKQKQVSNDDVTYSTVAVTPKSQPKFETEDVLYSTVVQHEE